MTRITAILRVKAERQRDIIGLLSSHRWGPTRPELRLYLYWRQAKHDKSGERMLDPWVGDGGAVRAAVATRCASGRQGQPPDPRSGAAGTFESEHRRESQRKRDLLSRRARHAGDRQRVLHLVRELGREQRDDDSDRFCTEHRRVTV